MEKKLNFKVCGLPAKYFIPFFIIVMATVYLGFMPVVKIYSNDAGKYMATSFRLSDGSWRSVLLAWKYHPDRK